MGIFDLFSKEPKTKSNELRSEFLERQTIYEQNKEQDQNKGPMSIFYTKSYDAVETIIATLKEKKMAVVHLNQLKQDTAIRVLDMLSGAIYALDGGVYEVEKNVFMFSPFGVEVNK